MKDLAFAVAFYLLPAVAARAAAIYVDADAAGTNDGSSWPTARLFATHAANRVADLRIEKLGQPLEAPSVAKKTVLDLSQAIGMESCFKCHQVHIPAAYARMRWTGGHEEHGGGGGEDGDEAHETHEVQEGH